MFIDRDSKRRKLITMGVVGAALATIFLGGFVAFGPVGSWLGPKPDSPKAFNRFKEMLGRDGMTSETATALRRAIPIGSLESEFIDRLKTADRISEGNEGRRFYDFGVVRSEGDRWVNIVVEGDPRRVIAHSFEVAIK